MLTVCLPRSPTSIDLLLSIDISFICDRVVAISDSDSRFRAGSETVVNESVLEYVVLGR